VAGKCVDGHLNPSLGFFFLYRFLYFFPFFFSIFNFFLFFFSFLDSLPGSGSRSGFDLAGLVGIIYSCLFQRTFLLPFFVCWFVRDVGYGMWDWGYLATYIQSIYSTYAQHLPTMEHHSCYEKR